MKGLVTIANGFHNTTARVRYPGGVHPIPVGALRKLCPSQGCRCLGSPAGWPYPYYKDQGIEVYYDYDQGRWVIAPADS